MSEDSDTRRYETVQLLPRAAGGRDRASCPECGHRLPVDERTECDRCGAHLTLVWRVDAPAVGTSTDEYE
jgi:DNA-directed RNA polymerase subunit RPC12/RpoP